MAFVRSRPDIVAPDLQYFMTMLIYEDSGRRIVPEHGFMVVFTLQRPESRGTIMIRSADPRAGNAEHGARLVERLVSAGAAMVSRLREGVA